MYHITALTLFMKAVSWHVVRVLFMSVNLRQLRRHSFNNGNAAIIIFLVGHFAVLSLVLLPALIAKECSWESTGRKHTHSAG